MSQTFITIITVMLVAVLLFIVPIMATANQNDNITKTAVQTILSEFVDTSAKEGKITQSNYDNLLQKLYATGNSYSVSLEVQKIGDSTIKTKEGAISSKAIGESVHYSEFTDEIISHLPYTLNQGDYVLASVKNTNVTMGTTIKNLVYSIMGKDTIAIEVSSSALVGATGR